MKRKLTGPPRPKARNMLAFAACAPSSVLESGAPGEDMDTILHGVLHRFIFNGSYKDADGLPALPLKPKAGLWESNFNWIDTRLARLGNSGAVPYTLLEYAKSFSSNPQRARYLDVAERYRFVPPSRSEVLGKNAIAHGFNKLEALKHGKASRTIQARSGEPVRTVKSGRIVTTESWVYPAVLGAHIKAFEKPTRDRLQQVYSSSVCGPWSCFAKGLPPDATARLIATIMEEGGLYAIMFDSSKWDGSVSKEALRYEHQVWQTTWSTPLFKALLKEQLVNKCVWRTSGGSFGFTVQGRRSSGDPNTGTGNDIINSAILANILRRLRCRGHLLVQGDDSVLFVPPRAFAEATSIIVGVYEEHGFRGEIEGVAFIPEQVDFCHVRPCRTLDGGWRAVKDVQEIVKDLRTVKQFGAKPSKRALVDYWATRAHASSIVYGGIPVFSTVAERLLDCATKAGGRVRPVYLDRYSIKMALKWGTSSAPVCPLSFAATQSLTPYHVTLIDDYYRDIAFTFDPGGVAPRSRGDW